MTRRLLILVGTKKGVFILDGNEERASWSLRGPYCEAWPINHVIAEGDGGTIYAGGGNEWFGPAVWKSEDLGKTWTHSSEGLRYGEGDDPIKSVWSLSPAQDRLLAGVEPAGLFSSGDGGETWEHIEGLREHPSRPHWMPGAGGLILHSIVPHPADDDQIWVGISTGGVFHTGDGGKTWQARNKGTRCDFAPDGEKFPEYGQCVHCVVMAPGEDTLLYQQNHCGMYRSDDGGVLWISIEDGLPSSFGFPAAVHPRDPSTLYLVPLNGDILGRYVPDGKAAVWRTHDRGDSWHDLREGLPQENAYFGVLRQAMATDELDPAGVYFGTSTGTLFASSDEGQSWQAIATHLPTVTSVETFVVAD